MTALRSRSPQPLNPAEASFFALDQPGLPMHIGALVVVAGSPPLTPRELQGLVSARLRQSRRFHQRVRRPFGGPPAWEPAGRIKPSQHFFRHALRPCAHESDLLDLCAELHRKPLRRDRPLWEVHLIDGVPGGRQAIYIKTHHAMGDGLTGMQIAEMLFEPAPGTPKPRRPVTRFAAETAHTPVRKALDAILGLVVTAVGGPLAAAGPFNGSVGGERAFATLTLPMRAVQRLRRELGVTVDDVLAATVASGISRYLREVGYARVPPALRTMVPVSMRPAQVSAAPNQVSAIFIDLPLNAGDPFATLASIVHQKQSLRRAHAAAGGSLLVDVAARLPAPLHGAVVRAVSGLRFANLVLSDIPGPAQPLYLLGRRIIACYPLMPLAPEIGLSIAAVRLGGKIGIGVTADPALVAEPGKLAHAIESAWTAFGGDATERRHRRAA